MSYFVAYVFPEENTVCINTNDNKLSVVQKNNSTQCQEIVECNDNNVYFFTQFGFRYTDKLIFSSLKEIRNIMFWSLIEDNIPNIQDVINLINNLDSCIDKLEILHTGDNNIGNGLYAKDDIKHIAMYPNMDIIGSIIGEYLGVVTESNIYTPYTMAYYISNGNGFEQNLLIEANEYGNNMRFINHSSLSPNVQFQHVYFCGLWHVLVVSIFMYVVWICVVYLYDIYLIMCW